jgi:hypothetical protein
LKGKLETLTIEKDWIESERLTRYEYFGSQYAVKWQILKDNELKSLKDAIINNIHVLFALAWQYESCFPPEKVYLKDKKVFTKDAPTLALYAHQECANIFVYTGTNRLMTTEKIGMVHVDQVGEKDILKLLETSKVNELVDLYNDLNILGGYMADLIVKSKEST